MSNKHFPLIVGISLPVIFIIIFFIVIFVPSLFVNPQHNFIYTLEHAEYAYGYEDDPSYYYEVEEGVIVLYPTIYRGNNDVPPPIPTNQEARTPRIYLYDVMKDTSTQISFEQAQKLSLSPGPSSPDGYVVDYNYSHSGIFELFGGSSGDNDGYFISKGNTKKKINILEAPRQRVYGDFRLIGWVQ